jgi:hypothetical protein
MNADHIDLRAEAESLNTHMTSLNHQNDCLAKELQEFIHVDEVVRKGLDRKREVLQVRERVHESMKKARIHFEKSSV